MAMIKIRVHHGGELVEFDGCEQYVGGELSEYIEDPDYLSPFDFIYNLQNKKYGATNVVIWYTLPGFSLSSGKRKLCNDEDVRQFCDAAMRDVSKTIDVYIEHLPDIPNYRSLDGVPEMPMHHTDEGRQEEFEMNDLFDNEHESSEDGVDCTENVDGSSSSDEYDGQFDQYESSSEDESLYPSSDEDLDADGINADGINALGVSMNTASVLGFQPIIDSETFTGDEDPLTDKESGDEFEHFNRPQQRFPAYNPECDPNEVRFCLLQTFKDGQEFRDAVTKYSIASHRDVRFERSNRIKVCVVCGAKPCRWRIYCSFERNIKKFQVKSLVGEHTCEPGEKVRLCNTAWLTKQFMEKFRANPSYKAKHLRIDCLNAYGVRVSMNKCWRARYACLRQLQGNQCEHFTKIRNYKLELERTNMNSTIALEVNSSDPQKPVFKRMYIGFVALKRGWLEGCRPIIGVDGCFLKWFVKGELLSAIGRDANNQMFPIAWAVVEVENSNSWEWFLGLLLKDIGFELGAGLTVISDGQKGLEAAMRKLMPHASHRLCVRHVYANWRKTHKMPELRPLFWRVAKAYTDNDVKDAMDEIQKISRDAAADLKNSNMSAWCRSYFIDHCLSDVVQNNLSESFNSSIRDARTKPIIDMFEDIRRAVMLRIAEKLNTIKEWPGMITPRVQTLIDRYLKKSYMCNVMCNGNKLYEVVYIDDVRVVDIDKKECSCRVWELTGIPCFHTLAVIMHRKESISDYVSAYYKKGAWARCYAHVLNPINGEKAWPRSADPIIYPPAERVMPGRRKRNRTKDPHESPNKKGKSSRHGRVMTCQYCLGIGHNSVGCQKRKQGEPRAPRSEPMRRHRGRPPSAQPRSSMTVRNQERGGKNKATTWNSQSNTRFSEERMFRNGYGVYHDIRTGEMMLQSGTSRYAANGSVWNTMPSTSQPTTSSQPSTSS